MTSSDKNNSQKVDPARTVLTAAAFILGALVIMQAGRLPGQPAYGEAAVFGNAYTILTADSGRGGDEQPDEIIVVIDNRAEVIMSYEVEGQQGGIIARDGGSLPFLFRNVLKR